MIVYTNCNITRLPYPHNYQLFSTKLPPGSNLGPPQQMSLLTHLPLYSSRCNCVKYHVIWVSWYHDHRILPIPAMISETAFRQLVGDLHQANTAKHTEFWKHVAKYEVLSDSSPGLCYLEFYIISLFSLASLIMQSRHNKTGQ